MRPRALALSLALAAAPASADPPWQTCLLMLPGHALTGRYFRACRPLPRACAATPTCACLARAMPRPFRASCRRVGHRFIRGTVALP